MNKTIIKIKKLYEDTKLPIHGSAAAAGYDVFAHFDLADGSDTIAPHETKKINTDNRMVTINKR
jgi:dUTPase